MESLFKLLVLAILGCQASGFIWSLDDILIPQKILTLSERYMFASHQGPPLLEQGDAWIKIDATITTYSKSNKSAPFSAAIFAAQENHHHDTLLGMCGIQDIHNNYWALKAHVEHVKTEFFAVEEIRNSKLGLNGTYNVWKIPIHVEYPVTLQEWHNVAFQFCSPESSSIVAVLTGSVGFRNPYGYIPGELYGFLPFEGARMIAYVFFGVFYFWLYFRHKDSLLPIHHAIALVYFVALAEATLWYASYQHINLTGQPYCCPFPLTVIGSLILQVFRQTVSRTLLVVVCLGYGIARPRLFVSEWVSVGVMTLLYFIAAMIAQSAEIILVNNVRSNESSNNSLQYQFPELVLDILFLSWIYLSLKNTLRVLAEFQQTVKTQMYQQLAYVIYIFVALFSLVTGLVMLDTYSIISWPWQISWLQQVLWEILNFSVIVAVCTLCRPSESCRFLAYASQLPTEDPDEESDEELGPSSSRKVLSPFRNSTLGYGGDDEDLGDDLEDDNDDNNLFGRKTSKMEMINTSNYHQRRQDLFSSLPDPEEDEEFGLEDDD